MNFNLTSSEEIIARVMRDFDINNINWKASGYDWIADAMRAINAWFAFETKVDVPFTVCNHKVEFPCDLIELLHVHYCGHKLPIGRRDKSVHCRPQITCGEIQNDLFNYEKIVEVKNLMDNLNALQLLYQGNPTTNLADRIAELTQQITNYSIPYAVSQSSRTYFEYYNLNPGVIETSFESGIINLTYTGAVSDDNGMPLIPDVYEFKEALAWYIVSRILLRGYEHPVIKWETANTEWENFKRRARNQVKMPSIDRMDALVKMWTNPLFNRHINRLHTYEAH